MAQPGEPAAIDTVVLHRCVANYQAGNAAAAERVLRYFGEQLEPSSAESLTVRVPYKIVDIAWSKLRSWA